MKILNFGSLNIDKVYTVEHFIRPGETMSVLGLETFCGGKGLNQSIAMARAGAQVYHAGAVGSKDGAMLLEMLAGSGVDTSHIKQTAGESGHAVIQVERSGQNCILLFGGANQEITEAQIDETLADFAAGDLLLLQNEISGIAYLLKRAKQKNMKIYLNPSPVTEELLKLPLDVVDCFILNEIEAADICGASAPEAALPRLLQEQYPNSTILLTLGSRGSVCYAGSRQYEQPSFRVPAVDTTGAGDTFTGYYIACTAGGADIPGALQMASKAAAIAVTRNGAATAIPWRKEVESAAL